MKKELLNIRCKYSRFALSERQSAIEKFGFVKGESLDGRSWIVLWDGLKQNQPVHKSWVELIINDPHNHYDYSKDEVMKPRVMLLMDYPGNEYAVGEIIKPSIDKFKKVFSKYPKIFKELFWAEKRWQFEMPRYVRITRDYLCYRCDEIYQVCDPHEDYRMKGCICILTIDDIVAYIPHHEKLIIPATEIEYNDYHDIGQ